MAKQDSALEIKGTIGNLTFYKSQDGYLVKKKTSLSKDKIKSDASFQRTRETMAEFSTAARAAKTLRAAFKKLLKQSSDNRVVSRLLTTMLRVVQADTINVPGKRTVVNNNLSLLDGFDFNIKGLLGVTLGAPYTITFTRSSGDVTLDFDSFIPALLIAAPDGTTHFKIQLAAAPVDFSAKKNTAVTAESAELPWDNTPTAALNLNLLLPAASTLPVFILLHVQFLKRVNGAFYALNNGAFNACGIVETDIP
jgi:hypothetical protein